jgi:hypothetical protein
MALRCGEQFRRRYMLGQIVPPSIAAARGTGVHSANDVNMTQKVLTAVDLPVDDLKDAARDGYVNSLKDGVFLTKEDVSAKKSLLNEGLNQAITLTELYHKEVAPEIQPLEVEHKFEVDVGLGIPLAGMMDIQRYNRVDDLKTAGLKWQEGRIQKEIQPVFYSLAHEKINKVRPKFIYHILIPYKSKEPMRQVQEITCTDNHYRSLISKAEIMIKMVETGLFPPANPTSWWCSPKWCGYYQTCKYVGN